MSNLVHGEIDDSDREAVCPECGATAEWVKCAECDGTGFIGEVREPPLVSGAVLSFALTAPQDECEACGGEGGWYCCPLGCPGERSVEQYLVKKYDKPLI